jgi:hypothetical protein
MKLWISAVALIMLCASPVRAQNVLRVPEDYSTIQAAALAAIPGDSIRVGPGVYCGAAFNKKLTILGEGQPIITACGSSTTGFLLLNPTSSGTIIRHLNFSGLNLGVLAVNGVNEVIIEHNTMQLSGKNALGIFSIYGEGSFWTVSHNDISIEAPNTGSGIATASGSGWTVSHNNLTGTGLQMGILFGRPVSTKTRAINNTVEFNHIEGAVDGVGIGLSGQEGAVVRKNEILMPSSSLDPSGVCGAWGIEVTDSGVYAKDGQQYALTSNNSLIMNNDIRGTAVGVIVLLDSLGGAGNSAGNVLRGNFGTLAINQPKLSCGTGTITGIVKNRSISNLINCDETGICNEIP